MKYNAETDRIEVLLDGKWVSVIVAGAQWNGVILKDGSFNASSGITSYHASDSYLIEVSSVEGIIDCVPQGTGSGIPIFAVIVPNAMINLSAYTKLTITGTVNAGASDVYSQMYIGIGKSEPITSEIFENMQVTRIGQVKGTTKTPFSTTIDITDITGYVWLAFKLQASGTNRTVYGTITSIYCSN